jgi:4-hydroxybenzoate polyprenyltransferase
MPVKNMKNKTDLTSSNDKQSTLIKIRKKAYYYLERSRPGGWIVNIILILLGQWYSLGKFPLFETFLAFVAIIGITSVGSWINFIFDRKLDDFAGKDVSFFNKDISPKEMSIISLIVNIICLFLLFYINIYVFLIGLLISILFLLYSTPQINLKTIPPFDIIVNSLVFGTLPFFIGWMIHLKFLNKYAIIYGLVIGLFIIVYYLLISSFDIEKDKKYGIKTSCTVLGLKNCINASLIIFFITLLITIFIFGISSILSIAFLTITPFMIYFKFIKNENSMRITLSIIYYILTGVILFLLFFYSHSKIPLVLFITILIIAIFTLLLYQNLKRSKINSKE